MNQAKTQMVKNSKGEVKTNPSELDALKYEKTKAGVSAKPKIIAEVTQEELNKSRLYNLYCVDRATVGACKAPKYLLLQDPRSWLRVRIGLDRDSKAMTNTPIIELNLLSRTLKDQRYSNILDDQELKRQYGKKLGGAPLVYVLKMNEMNGSWTGVLPKYVAVELFKQRHLLPKPESVRETKARDIHKNIIQDDHANYSTSKYSSSANSYVLDDVYDEHVQSKQQVAVDTLYNLKDEGDDIPFEMIYEIRPVANSIMEDGSIRPVFAEPVTLFNDVKMALSRINELDDAVYNEESIGYDEETKSETVMPYDLRDLLDANKIFEYII